MKRLIACAVLGWAGLSSVAAHAQAVNNPQGALQLLQKVAVATNKLDYSGTFVYRRGNQSETSRIVHVSRNGNSMERLEVLDGSPREVIRHNDAVECYLPDERLIIVEQRSARRTFPALLPASLANLAEYYQLRMQGEARIAGMDSRIIRLDPKDAWRHGHQFWVDAANGLLLKAEVLDERGQSLESMAFTELRIGVPEKHVSVKSSYADAVALKDSWTVRQSKLSDLRDDANWTFRAELPGFRRQASMRRSISRDKPAAEDVLHWVYSDGLAAFSVFISPLKGPAAGSEAVEVMGAISMMKRTVDGHEIVVMGDLPPAAIRRFAEGIGRGK